MTKPSWDNLNKCKKYSIFSFSASLISILVIAFFSYLIFLQSNGEAEWGCLYQSDCMAPAPALLLVWFVICVIPATIIGAIVGYIVDKKRK